MKLRILAALLLCAPAIAGCASVVDGTTQPVYVATTPESGANCTVSNDAGQWTLTSPATVIVHKSNSVLSIRCSKPGWKDATFYASGRMSTAGMIGIMLPYAGLVNAAVDGSTGAAQNYPTSYTLEMKPAPAPAAVTATVAIAPPPSAARIQGAAPTGQTQ